MCDTNVMITTSGFSRFIFPDPVYYYCASTARVGSLKPYDIMFLLRYGNVDYKGEYFLCAHGVIYVLVYYVRQCQQERFFLLFAMRWWLLLTPHRQHVM